MTAIPPMAFEWTSEGGLFPKHPKLADRYYVVGETYTMEERNDRSAASHSHYFVSVAEAHSNLPEEIAERLPTPDHLRRYALIKTGYRDERSIVCASKAEAQRLAAFIKPIDDFAIVIVQEATIICYTAKSQSLRAMGKADFQASKQAVLDVIAQMIGVNTKTLEQNAAAA